MAFLIINKKIPLKVVTAMYSSSAVMYCLSRFLTVRTIYKLKFSGAVSSITAFYSFIGLLARFLTLMNEFSSDLLLMTSMSF